MFVDETGKWAHETLSDAVVVASVRKDGARSPVREPLYVVGWVAGKPQHLVV